MRKILIIPTFLILAILCLPLLAQGQDLQILVYDSLSRRPIEKAVLKVVELPQLNLETDQQGRCRIPRNTLSNLDEINIFVKAPDNSNYFDFKISTNSRQSILTISNHSPLNQNRLNVNTEGAADTVSTDQSLDLDASLDRISRIESQKINSKYNASALIIPVNQVQESLGSSLEIIQKADSLSVNSQDVLTILELQGVMNFIQSLITHLKLNPCLVDTERNQLAGQLDSLDQTMQGLQSKLNSLEVIKENKQIYRAQSELARENILKAQALLGKNKYIVNQDVFRYYSYGLGLLVLLTALFIYLFVRIRTQKAQLAEQVQQIIAQNYKIKDQHSEINNQKEHLSNYAKQLEKNNGELENLAAYNSFLLREIQHRVNNNFQRTIDLIDLQILNSNNQEVIDVLNGIQNRIYSMALIHKKLENPAQQEQERISLHLYLKELVDSLFTSLKPQNKEIHQELSSVDARFDIEKTSHLGLIVNELITNSFKYAFVGRQEGKIWVNLFKMTESNYRLIVGDDGIGLAEPSPASLGLNLVKSLVDKLRGRIQTTSNSGTEHQIDFEVHD